MKKLQNHMVRYISQTETTETKTIHIAISIPITIRMIKA